MAPSNLPTPLVASVSFGKSDCEKPPVGFTWVATDEPHATRRKQILEKYPQIKSLYGYEPLTKWLVLPVIIAQLVLGWYAPTWSWWQFLLISYVVGGTLNHCLFLAIHEVTHNLAFLKPSHNRNFAIFCNLPIGAPYAVAFKQYHAEHHQNQGIDGIDVDIPTEFEGFFFTTPFRKFLFCFFQILFYAFRPLLVRPRTPDFDDLRNWGYILAFYAVFLYARAIVPGIEQPSYALLTWFYFIWSSFCAGALHPMSGHFISEHYTFGKDQETFSYYGILNLLSWNVGYHNEHHDFPYVAWTRLPAVRRMAPEFYDTLPHYTSWVKVLYDFITQPNVNCYSRVKRFPKQNASDPSSSTSSPTPNVSTHKKDK